MNIIRHAFEQMKERGFTVEMLGRLVCGRTYIRTSETDDCRYLMTGIVNKKWWTIVLDKDLYTVITVRRAHEDEIKEAQSSF